MKKEGILKLIRIIDIMWVDLYGYLMKLEYPR